ncbi:hypothetical protein HII31_06660 [Pseudocercospora fuligena]|uniref:Uncharacterized protein n=1 Tax=Pseudocercospora fuligena TaxID=685502 RepID=A0A8H6RHQ0_9PEZI|nr:hypothetical protein HII31_06660 [Pseudocercospora fuligena]
MATERILTEVKSGDLPSISIGNFSWQAVGEKQLLSRAANGAVTNGAGAAAVQPAAPKGDDQQVLLNKAFATAPPLTKEDFPLNLLENKTFSGKGYNTIWRGASDVLELNLTAESTAFTASLGNVPNRGVSQDDITLKGLAYLQRVGAFEDETTGLDNSKNPSAIHLEPGCLMLVPNCASPTQGATMNRMASVPHGTTINAQGLAPKAMQSTTTAALVKSIAKVSITPFNIGKPNSLANFFQDRQTIGTGKVANRLPGNLTKFSEKKTIDQDVLNNPNEVLTRALDGQQIESFTTFVVTTDPSSEKGKEYFGGGTANIGFLLGTTVSGPLMTNGKPDPNGQPSPSGNENAHAIRMKCRYWIETVTDTLTIKPGNKEPFTFPPRVSKTGIPGPTFVAPPTDKITQERKIKVKWTQIQYSQDVTLNFNGLSWPHISVATLGDVGTYTLLLQKDTFGPVGA